jgi:hypothetical protein
MRSKTGGAVAANHNIFSHTSSYIVRKFEDYTQ